MLDRLIDGQAEEFLRKFTKNGFCFVVCFWGFLFFFVSRVYFSSIFNAAARPKTAQKKGVPNNNTKAGAFKAQGVALSPSSPLYLSLIRWISAAFATFFLLALPSLLALPWRIIQFSIWHLKLEIHVRTCCSCCCLCCCCLCCCCGCCVVVIFAINCNSMRKGASKQAAATRRSLDNNQCGNRLHSFAKLPLLPSYPLLCCKWCKLRLQQGGIRILVSIKRSKFYSHLRITVR